MIKIGCCANMVANESGGFGIEIIEKISEMGYDYIELSLSHIMNMDDNEFSFLIERVSSSGISCEACNNFFPASIRLTGKNADLKKTMVYVEEALSRACRLGAQIIVFGSSEAKNIPDGFSKEKAWMQIVEFLRTIDDVAREKGITIVIEPLNRIESNLVNTVSEGYNLVKQVDRKNIRLLVDYYHLMVEKEEPDVIIEAGEFIEHIHFARLFGRLYPVYIDECAYDIFFKNIKKINYQRGISIEGYTKNFERDAEKALKLVKHYIL